MFELIAFCVADNAESGLVDGTELLVAKLRPNADLAWVGNQFLVIQNGNFKSLIRGWRLDIAQRRGGGRGNPIGRIVSQQFGTTQCW